jgi:glycosyltransferase involved in cell wall biosynthesis
MTRRARLVIAVSEATKRDLVERMGVPERMVRVVYPGVGGAFRQSVAAERMAEVRRRYGLPDAFILSVGTLEPRKNLSGTLQAYRLLRERLADAPSLVLVGGSGWRLDERRLLPESEARHVRRLGFVPDEDLAALYASCSAFVYPSFHEGFGSPVAEAMTFGAPTITSNVSSLPEVAGDATLLVNPRYPEEIAVALERILGDSTLSARLRLHGPARVHQFSYESCALQTMQVYQEAVAG